MSGEALCGACAKQQEEKAYSWEAWILLAVAAAAVVSWRTSPDSFLTIALLLFCLPYGVSLGITVIHEAAHAIVAVGTGLRVRGIQVGVGPRIMRIGGDRFHVAFHLLPTGGFTFFTTEHLIHRGRQILSTVAGPLSGAVIFLLGWGWEVPDGRWQPWIRVAVLWVSGLGVVMNAFPIRRLNNDGWRFVWLLRAPDQEIQSLSETDQRDDLARELAAYESERKDDPRRLLQIRADLTERLDDVGLQPASRALVLNNLAFATLLLDDASLLPEAERWAAEAVELLPFQPELLDTLGVCLLRLGRDAEGISLLERALPRLTPDRASKGRAHLALAQIRSGNLFEARRSYLLARDHGAHGPAFTEAGNRIAAAELRNLGDQFAGRQPEEIVESLKEVATPEFVKDLGWRLRDWAETSSAAAKRDLVMDSGLVGAAGGAEGALDDLIEAFLEE